VPAHVLPATALPPSAAERFHAQLVKRGLRAELLPEHDSLARRIAQAHASAVPYTAIIGAREAAANSVTLRERSGQRLLGHTEAMAEIARLCAKPRLDT